MSEPHQDAEARQTRLFDYLAAKGASGEPVIRIDTHSAVVFLMGKRAIKIKRAVRFPFLDFSTLQRRKAACDEELRVNAAFAPALYKRVAPIVARDSAFVLDGDGEPVEWAVVMTRFNENQSLDRLARAGAIPEALAVATADVIADAHRKAQRADDAAWVASIDGLIAQNQAALTALYPPEEVAALTAASRAALERVRALLLKRAAAGFVRRCHGDLHLANIALQDGRPFLFDALEFDAAMATTDVLYDLAFALMDLLHYDQRPAANTVLNRYLAAGEPDHLDALAALPLFLSLRAAIRAHVLLSRPSRNDAEAGACRAEAHRYFALAREAISPGAPRMVAVAGLSGTGKSGLARALAPRFGPLPGAVLLRSDVVRKASFGVDETQPLPPEAYRDEVTARIYRALADVAARIVRAGHSVIVDAVFAREAERDRIEAAAAQCGARFDGLFLQASRQTREARVMKRSGDASDATAAIVAQQENYDLGRIGWMSIDAEQSAEATLQNASARLGLASG